MKVIESAIMPNETAIQLEDWSEKNTPEYPDLYGLTIGAYPVAQRSSGYWIKGGEMSNGKLVYRQAENYR